MLQSHRIVWRFGGFLAANKKASKLIRKTWLKWAKIKDVGAEDDTLWDTAKYIRRAQKRLDERAHDCDVQTLVYKHGTHFVFPQSVLKKIFPIGSGLILKLMFKAAREYPKECKQMRLDLDDKIDKVIDEWKNK